MEAMHRWDHLTALPALGKCMQARCVSGHSHSDGAPNFLGSAPHHLREVACQVARQGSAWEDEGRLEAMALAGEEVGYG